MEGFNSIPTFNFELVIDVHVALDNGLHVSLFIFCCQLASKTSELSKACEKQFKLEQELAFYKLDAKFEHLGMLPLPDGVEVSLFFLAHL